MKMDKGNLIVPKDRISELKTNIEQRKKDIIVFSCSSHGLLQLPC